MLLQNHIKAWEIDGAEAELRQATGATGATGAGAEPSDHHKLVQKGRRAPLAAPNLPNLRVLDGQQRGHR